MSLSCQPPLPAQPWQQLLPWSTADQGSPVLCQLWALASCSAAGLQLHYRLIWTPAESPLIVPQPREGDSGGPQRRDGLWQHSCFEAFVGVLGSEAYWEFNLSPCGDWNVYRFDGYRSGQRLEMAYGQLPIAISGSRRDVPGAKRQLQLDLACPLPPTLQQSVRAGAVLELGLTAVIEQVDGALSYWALQHPGSEPDFHDRRGWLLRL